MDKIKQLEGSITDEDIILGLLTASKDNTIGSIWEKCVTCESCKFVKQCRTIYTTLENDGREPYCREVISLLLGELKLEDIKYR